MRQSLITYKHYCKENIENKKNLSKRNDHHAAVPYHIQKTLQGKYRKQKKSFQKKRPPCGSPLSQTLQQVKYRKQKQKKFFQKETTVMRQSLITYKLHYKENIENKREEILSKRNNHHAAVPYHIQKPLQGKYRKQKE